MVSRWMVLLVLVSLFTSCGRQAPPPSDVAAFGAWIADPGNGYVVTKVFTDLAFSMQHLPSEYLGWRDLRREELEPGSPAADSILTGYAGSLHFILTVSPREGKSAGDVLYKGVNSEASFQERVRQLNFRMAEYFELRVGEERLAPLLAVMENTYGLTEYRKVNLVFPMPMDGEAAWDLYFEDGVWGSGGWHFGFVSH